MWIENEEGQMEYEVMYEEDLNCYDEVERGLMWAALEAAGVVLNATNVLLDEFDFDSVEEF